LLDETEVMITSVDCCCRWSLALISCAAFMMVPLRLLIAFAISLSLIINSTTYLGDFFLLSIVDAYVPWGAMGLLWQGLKDRTNEDYQPKNSLS